VLNPIKKICLMHLAVAA